VREKKAEQPCGKKHLFDEHKTARTPYGQTLMSNNSAFNTFSYWLKKDHFLLMKERLKR